MRLFASPSRPAAWDLQRFCLIIDEVWIFEDSYKLLSTVTFVKYIETDAAQVYSGHWVLA